jgi:hypothetical protein
MLAPRICRCFLGFWKICRSLVISVIKSRKMGQNTLHEREKHSKVVAVTKWRHTGGVILNLGARGQRVVYFAPRPLYPPERKGVPNNTRWRGPQSRSVLLFENRKNPLRLSGFKPPDRVIRNLVMTPTTLRGHHLLPGVLVLSLAGVSALLSNWVPNLQRNCWAMWLITYSSLLHHHAWKKVT